MPETIIAEGSHVVALGHGSGIESATGAAFRVHFVQHFKVADGRIARMTEYRVWITQEPPRKDEASSGFRLPAAPKEVQPYFRDTFNAGDLDALMRMYADKAVFVPTPGMALDQPEAIRKATADFMGLKLPFAMTPRHLYVSEDTALMISDWVLEGAGPDGKPMKLTGTTADVAREQADGTWRVIIDNPFGTA